MILFKQTERTDTEYNELGISSSNIRLKSLTSSNINDEQINECDNENLGNIIKIHCLINLCSLRAPPRNSHLMSIHRGGSLAGDRRSLSLRTHRAERQVN